jgi:transcriptional regulator with XRE-family HTH domain
MRDRIRKVRKSLGFNQAKFAKKIGLTQTSLSMIEVGQNTLTDKNIKLICATFNVNENWLRTGEGLMFNSSPYTNEITKIMECLAPETQQYLLVMARELLNTQEKLLNRQNDGSTAGAAKDANDAGEETE